ncbi:hypothetical protein [Streptomyces sp. NPDC002324]
MVGVRGTSRRQTAVAAATWLLAAALDQNAFTAWGEPDGIALLRCGGIFGAVRLSADLVRAAADTENTKKINAFLAEALDGPVFMDQYARSYYVLVPVSTGKRPEWPASGRLRDAKFLGRTWIVGVPRLDATAPSRTRRYWCVPMDGPGALADPAAVSKLAAGSTGSATATPAA